MGVDRKQAKNHSLSQPQSTPLQGTVAELANHPEFSMGPPCHPSSWWSHRLCKGVISQELLVLQHPGLQRSFGPKEKRSTPTLPRCVGAAVPAAGGAC